MTNKTTGEICLGIVQYAFEHDNPGLDFERNQTMYLANDTNAAYVLHLEKYIKRMVDYNVEKAGEDDE